MLYNWFPPPKQQKKKRTWPSVFLLISPLESFPLDGLHQASHQLNVCVWTASWTHECCIFFRWQRQDRQRYQISSWNINHLEIFGFKAQLQLSERLSKITPMSGRSVLCKGCFPEVEIHSSHMQVGLGKERRNYSRPHCRAVWGPPCHPCFSLDTKKRVANTSLHEFS